MTESSIYDVKVAPQLPSVIVCIPAFNEETRIGPVVRRARKFAEEVLVCDDGSSDHTSLEATSNGGVVIRQTKNRGKGASLRLLLQEAMQMTPDVIVTLDGDGQHDPSDIPKLLSPILNGSAEIVIGSRFGPGNVVPFHRRVGNSILTKLTNVVARTKVRDTQSGFRAYSSKVMSSISITNDGMGVDSEILIKAVRAGYRVVEKEVSVRYEGETSTFNPISHTLRVLVALTEAFFE